MIATLDAQSSYMTPPTLRLFDQPLDLLPPEAQRNTASGQQLAPEYADPVTGQVKCPEWASRCT